MSDALYARDGDSLRAQRADPRALGSGRPARRPAGRAARSRARALRAARGRAHRPDHVRDPRPGAAGAADASRRAWCGPGRSVELLEAELSGPNGPVMRASAWRLRTVPVELEPEPTVRAAAARSRARLAHGLLPDRRRRRLPHRDRVPLRARRLHGASGRPRSGSAWGTRSWRASRPRPLQTRAGGRRLRQRRQRGARLPPLHVHQHRAERAPAALPGGRVGLPRLGHHARRRTGSA